MPAPVTGVVLAAGAGTRLGRGPKALLSFHGRPLIEHILDQLHDGGCQTAAVVLGADAERVQATAGLGDAVVVVNPDWESGMASSFRAGVDAAAAAAPDAGYLLVALGDQPGISAAVVARLLEARTPGRITAAGYRNSADRNSTDRNPGDGDPDAPDPESETLRRGHPMIFDRELARRAAAAARGDEGARTFLAANGHLVDVVDCTGAGDGLDVDTPADLPLLERPIE